MSSYITSSSLLHFCEEQKQINILSNIDDILIPKTDYLIGSTVLNYDSVDAPEYIPSNKYDASKIDSLEFVLANKIEMNPRPFIKKSKCYKDKECQKSNCVYSHDISWYKRESHFIRIYNEHQKEIKSIMEFKIPMFPKLLPHYQEILNYHNELSSLALKYAEIYKNDMSYLIEKPITNKIWDTLGKRYKY